MIGIWCPYERDPVKAFAPFPPCEDTLTLCTTEEKSHQNPSHRPTASRTVRNIFLLFTYIPVASRFMVFCGSGLKGLRHLVNRDCVSAGLVVNAGSMA